MEVSELQVPRISIINLANYFIIFLSILHIFLTPIVNIGLWNTHESKTAQLNK